jgi:two-component system phosphate regulon sensor histidine kinase PhoR
MSWLAQRVLVAAFSAVLGALIGWVLGRELGAATAGMVVGVVLAAILVAVMDALGGARLLAWLRGPLSRQVPQGSGYWGELAYRFERALRASEAAARMEQNRLEQFLSAIEASPNGVLLLDAGEQIEWCNGVAADHFGLDPQRDKRQRVTNLVRSPAFVACLQGADFREPVVFVGPGRLTLSIVVRAYGEGMKLVLSQDVTERERADAMRRDFVPMCRTRSARR